MSSLTKIFIVVLVLFSITFTTMMVAVVVQTPNWKENADKYRDNARICETNLRHAHAASAARLATARDSVLASEKIVSDLKARQATTLTDISELRTQLAKSSAEKSNTEAINRGLLAHLEVAENARAEYRRQRNDLETRDIDIERRNVDLNDRVNELTASVAVLLEQKRQYEQQLNILKEENAALSQSTRTRSRFAFESPQGVAMSGVEAITKVARSAIRGKVLEVSDDFVTLSIGRADGVRKGMLFVVHRGAKFIGEVEISLVDPNVSVGRLVRSREAPTPNDLVTDALALGK